MGPLFKILYTRIFLHPHHTVSVTDERSNQIYRKIINGNVALSFLRTSTDTEIIKPELFSAVVE